jgi:hypothetical protein
MIEKYKSENLSSFCLLVGYSEYIAMPYFLHSVQTLRDKKGEAISHEQHTITAV